MVIVDIILVVIIGIAALIGFIKGAMKSLISLCGLVLSLLVAYFLAGYVLDLVSGWGFVQKLFFADTGSIASWAASKLEALAGIPAGVTPEQLTEYLAGTPFAMAAPLIAAALPLLDTSARTLPQAVGLICANFVLFSIITMILFVIIRVILGIVESIINKIRKNKVVGSVDHFLGILVGTVKGLVAAVCILAIIYALAIPFDFMDGIVEKINSSLLTGPLYGFVGNLIEKYFNLSSFLSGLIPAGEQITAMLSLTR